MNIAKIDTIYGINKDIPGLNVDKQADQNTFIRDPLDKTLYIGNSDQSLTEIKTDKSHNWAKTFFYGGS